MKPMIWHPDQHDSKMNQSLDQINHPPYITILGLLLGLFCFLTFFILFSSF